VPDFLRYLLMEIRAEHMQQDATSKTGTTATPVLVFDGECELCVGWARRWQRAGGGNLECIPFQRADVAVRFPRLSSERLAQSVHLIEPDGTIRRGAEAVLHRPGGGRLRCWLRRIYERSPAFARAAEACYRFMARHRRAAAAATRLLNKLR
jgi:predicted DCC family thiol-disulfide oxidoreductase YuxK